MPLGVDFECGVYRNYKQYEDLRYTEFLHKYMATKITVQPDWAYSLKFPWKDSHPSLPSNYTICYRRNRSMVRWLTKMPRILKMYNSIIKEQETEAFILRVDDNYQRGSVHYILHHPIYKESSTTPIRIVFDYSCKSSAESCSLNNCLHPGPHLIYSSHKPITSGNTTATTRCDIFILNIICASAIFDPVGLISLVMISIKLFHQTLWQ